MIIISHIMILDNNNNNNNSNNNNNTNNNNNNDDNDDHKQVFSKYLASCSLLSDVIRHGMAGLELTFTGWISCFLI